jgi:hypothetical protein
MASFSIQTAVYGIMARFPRGTRGTIIVACTAYDYREDAHVSAVVE